MPMQKKKKKRVSESTGGPKGEGEDYSLMN